MSPSADKPHGRYSLFTVAQVREIDRRAVVSGIPPAELMRRAGLAAFALLCDRWPQLSALLILCGRGNNGGDGYVIAELALQHGLDVTVLSMGECTSEQAAQAQAAARHAGVRVLAYEDAVYRTLLQAKDAQGCLIVDALLGTGTQGALRGDYLAAVQLSDSSALPILAIDTPSGLDSDTGFTERAIHATATVSFIARKRGLYTGLAADHTGEIHFADLQVIIPTEIANRPAAHSIDAAIIPDLLKPRSRASHKGVNGNVLVIGGDEGLGGAALMTAEAACRSGAGTVSLVTRVAHVPAVLTRRPEVMALGLDDWNDKIAQQFMSMLARSSAIVLGPGLGQSRWSLNMLQQCLTWAVRHEIPLVLDADAINLMVRQAWSWSDAPASIRRKWVLTPHPGEAARLLGEVVADIERDRFAAVSRLQTLTGAVCLIKGAGTVLALPDPDEGGTTLEVCREGNPGMASGGMGDVLAGVLGALLAQGMTMSDATRVAVCAHGEAADRAASMLGERGLLATDLMLCLPSVLNEK
jgi:ADP-dependent NAD(P)H-hydrate dehydratase / NAD(P)H-hydrate epimerase